MNAATDWHLPALFMEGRAPFRAQRRFPPKGTYCWLRGKLSVFKSCRRCFSLRMEWTVFRKSFLLSGELKKIREHYQFATLQITVDRTLSMQASIYGGIQPPFKDILTYSTAEMSSQAFPLILTLCGQSHTQLNPRHLRK